MRDVQWAIVDGVHKLTGLKGMIGNPATNVTRPTEPYFAVTYKSSYKEGLSNRGYQYDGKNLSEDLTQVVVLNFSVSFYKENSQVSSLIASSGMPRADIRKYLQDVGCSFRKANNPYSFSEPLMDGWEERATFDLEIATQIESTADIDYIDSFSLHGQVVYEDHVDYVEALIGNPSLNFVEIRKINELYEYTNFSLPTTKRWESTWK